MAVTRKTTTRNAAATPAIDTSNMSKKACYDYLVDQICLFETRKELSDEGYSLDDLRDLVAEEMEKETGGKAAKAPARTAPASRAAAPSSAAIDPDKMRYGACLEYLVNEAKLYKTKSELKNAVSGVAELRTMIKEHLAGGKGGKSSRRHAEPAAEPVQRRTRREEPAAEPVQRRTRREEPAAEPVQRRTRRGAASTPALSPIVAFTRDNIEDIVGDVNTSITDINAAICAATGLDMVGADSLHYTYVHEKALFLTFALGTTGISHKAFAKFLAEARDATKAEAANDEPEDDFQDDAAPEKAGPPDEELIEDLIDAVIDRAGLTEDKARKYVEAWFANYDDEIEPLLGVDVEIGSELYNDDDHLIVVVGFNKKSGKLIAFNEETGKLALYTPTEISNFDFADDIDAADAADASDADPEDEDADPEDEFDDFA